MIRFPWPLENEVHIHCKSLATEIARYTSPEESIKAARLLDPHKRNNSLTGRGLLREILGNYLGLQPTELHFSEGEHGKPYLSGIPTNTSRLHFNLSHSGPLFLLAIAANREVGVDIEQLTDYTPFPDMARLAFSLREQKELFILPDYLQRSAFYRCWTRKEAYLKACGMGFALPSNSFDVSLLPENQVSLISPDGLSHWHLQDLCVPEDYHATLAVHGFIPIIRYIL